MTNVARLTDTISHGGEIITGSPNTILNNLQVARIGDLVDCAIHGINAIITGSSTVIVNGVGVARLFDRTECGAEIVTASPNEIAGG